jgi:hypothetical protein
MTDYQRGYAAALADCQRVVETEPEFPTEPTQEERDGIVAAWGAHPFEALRASVRTTKKSILSRLPRGPVEE